MLYFKKFIKYGINNETVIILLTTKRRHPTTLHHKKNLNLSSYAL
jgi:hypothetical protein